VRLDQFRQAVIEGLKSNEYARKKEKKNTYKAFPNDECAVTADTSILVF